MKRVVIFTVHARYQPAKSVTGPAKPRAYTPALGANLDINNPNTLVRKAPYTPLLTCEHSSLSPQHKMIQMIKNIKIINNIKMIKMIKMIKIIKMIKMINMIKK